MICSFFSLRLFFVKHHFTEDSKGKKHENDTHELASVYFFVDNSRGRNETSASLASSDRQRSQEMHRPKGKKIDLEVLMTTVVRSIHVEG